jgi:hypothetical protein
MNTARRRQQGYRVNKREIQDPLSSFAQNGIKTQGDPPNPLDMLQEDVSPFVRGMKDVSEFNTQYNDMMYALADYQNMLKRREEMTPKSTVQVGMRPIKDTPQSNYITASDIAALADGRVPEGEAVMTFDDLMSQFAWVESRNQNIYQEGGPAQAEYQMEHAARLAANNYAQAIAKATGKDFVPFTEEQLSDIVNNLNKDQRDLLAYSYTYGPEDVKTADVLTGKVDVPEFWFENWNKGRIDRTDEARERLKDYPGR